MAVSFCPSIIAIKKPGRSIRIKFFHIVYLKVVLKNANISKFSHSKV